MKKLTRRFLLGTLLLLLVISSLNCYTVLRRPGDVTSEEARYLAQDYYEEEVDPGYLWYDPFHSWYYPDAYARWRYYYDYPWWWNDYWYWHPGDDEGMTEDSDRYIWERRKTPDWSGPPSTSRPPTSASQPREQQKKSEDKPSPVVPQRSRQRSRSDWRTKPERPETPEQKSKDQEKDEESEQQGTGQ